MKPISKLGACWLVLTMQVATVLSNVYYIPGKQYSYQYTGYTDMDRLGKFTVEAQVHLLYIFVFPKIYNSSLIETLFR